MKTKRAKLIASLVGIVVFSVLCYLAISTLKDHTTDDESPDYISYAPSHGQDVVVTEDEYIFLSELHETEEAGDYEEEFHKEYYEEENDEDREGAYNPEFIGDGIIGTDLSPDQEKGDLDSISSSLSYFRDGIYLDDGFPDIIPPVLSYRHPESEYNGFGSKAYDGIIRLFWSNKRSISFSGIIEAYSNLIKLQISDEVYKARGYDRMVLQLIHAYEDLSKHPEHFPTIYQIMCNREVYDEADNWYEAYKKYYEMIEAYVPEESLATFEYGKDDYCRIVWAYSFWGRRYNEGIHRNVYEGLLKLREIYE